MAKRIWLSPPHLGGQEIKMVQQAFDDNWVAPAGPHIAGFEQDLAEYLGENKHVASLDSGTAAIHLAYISCGVKANDLVLCQSLTFAASAYPIRYLGAQPVFVDSDPETWNMSPVFLEEAIIDCIQKGKKPKAILYVELYGMPAKIDEILSIAHRYEIPLIEDAAEALGSCYSGRKCGTFGDFSIISFNGNKIITTSGGGALVCSTAEEADFARFLATQAKDPAPHFQHSTIGYNYRMSNISAGIGRGQMTVLEERIRQRRDVHDFYSTELTPLPGIKIHQEPNERCFSNHWLTCILVDPALTGGISREDIRIKLDQFNIESRPLWKPMHLQPVFEGCPFFGDGTSEKLFNQGLCLPSGSALTKPELEQITDIIKNN